jgi:hypothetical protein
MNNTPQETITQEVIEDAKKAGLLSQVDEYGTYWFNNINGKSLRKFAQLTRERQTIEASQSEPVAMRLKLDELTFSWRDYDAKVIELAAKNGYTVELSYLAAPQQAIPSGWLPLPTKNIEMVKQVADFQVLIGFKSCRAAGEFKAALEGKSASPTAPIARDK